MEDDPLSHLVALSHLNVKDRRKRLLTVGMLRGEREKGSDTESDPSRDSLGLDPEADPGHNDDEAGGDVGVEEVVAQPPLKHEDHLQTRKVTCRHKLFTTGPWLAINNSFANKKVTNTCL